MKIRNLHLLVETGSYPTPETPKEVSEYVNKGKIVFILWDVISVIGDATDYDLSGARLLLDDVPIFPESPNKDGKAWYGNNGDVKPLMRVDIPILRDQSKLTLQGYQNTADVMAVQVLVFLEEG